MIIQMSMDALSLLSRILQRTGIHCSLYYTTPKSKFIACDPSLSLTKPCGRKYISGTNVLPTTRLLPMLRLGRKYGLERFKTEALQQLHRMYPRTLEGLDDILDQKLGELNQSMKHLQRVGNGEEFAMLKAMSELGIETVLPTLYYFCVWERSLVSSEYVGSMHGQMIVFFMSGQHFRRSRCTYRPSLSFFRDAVFPSNRKREDLPSVSECNLLLVAQRKDLSFLRFSGVVHQEGTDCPSEPSQRWWH